MAEILLVGNYRPISESRSALLRSTCSVTHCTTEEESTKLASQNVDVAILCHSIAMNRRSALGEKIRRLPSGVLTQADAASALEYADAAAPSLNRMS